MIRVSSIDIDSLTSYDDEDHQRTVETALWVQKYAPAQYTELLSDEVIFIVLFTSLGWLIYYDWLI